MANASTSNRTYFVCQSFNRPKHGKRRLIDLPDFLVDELETYIGHLKKERLRTGSGGKINLLFIDPAEKRPLPYSQRKIQYLMKKASKAAGLRIRNPHDLRHTYATLVLMSHMSPGYVQKQLGHSSISITMDIILPLDSDARQAGAGGGVRRACGCTRSWRPTAYNRISKEKGFSK